MFPPLQIVYCQDTFLVTILFQESTTLSWVILTDSYLEKCTSTRGGQAYCLYAEQVDYVTPAPSSCLNIELRPPGRQLHRTIASTKTTVTS